VPPARLLGCLAMPPQLAMSRPGPDIGRPSVRTAVRTMASRKPVASGNDRLSAVMLSSLKPLVTGTIGRHRLRRVYTENAPGRAGGQEVPGSNPGSPTRSEGSVGGPGGAQLRLLPLLVVGENRLQLRRKWQRRVGRLRLQPADDRLAALFGDRALGVRRSAAMAPRWGFT